MVITYRHKVTVGWANKSKGNMKTLTMKQKWAEVDRLLDGINDRKSKGQTPCTTELEEYVNYHFNGGRNATD